MLARLTEVHFGIRRTCAAALSMNSVNDEAEPFDPARLLHALGVPRSVRNYPPRGVIFAQGDPCDAVYYLQYGQVKLSLRSPKGKDAVIAVVGAGDFFGERSLGGQLVRAMTATAIAASSVLRIEKADMERALRDEPSVSSRFIAHLLARNIRVEEDLADQLFNSSEKRLARALLLLTNFGRDGQQTATTTKVNQATLAEMIGTTRPRVSFFMNKFRRLGFIDYKDGVRVNRSLLTVIL